jgi:putative heme-binding domain-containing protein
LLAAVAAGRIPIADIGSYDVRQLRALGDAVVDAEAEKLWGGGRDTPEAKRLRIAALKDSLGPAALAAADLPRGRGHFDRNCGRCHRLFGAGETVGPDLTGGNRTNLDYLLENMVDPSGVVPREYRMSVVTLADGRVLGGLVVSRDDRSLTLVTPTDRQVIPLTDVEQVTLTTQSPMPDGMLDQLSADAVRDLVGYLMQPAQVPAIQVPAIQVPAIQVPAIQVPAE